MAVVVWQWVQMGIGVHFAIRPSEARCIWVTRTAPHNLLTARHLRRLGWDVLVQPVLNVATIANEAPLEVPDALIFTSLQGVRLHSFYPGLAGLPTFAVGDHTARFARIQGYRHVRSACGDVHDLRAIIREGMPPGSRILHFSARSPAGDLLGMLRGDGFVARRRCVYETIEASRIDLEWVVGVLHKIDHIIVHSPRAGRRVASLLFDEGRFWSGTILCISAAAAEPFRHLPVETKVANAPTERALLEISSLDPQESRTLLR